jgi:hypothetical protein
VLDLLIGCIMLAIAGNLVLAEGLG